MSWLESERGVSGALHCLSDVPGIAVGSGAATGQLPGRNDVLASHCFMMR